MSAEQGSGSTEAATTVKKARDALATVNALGGVWLLLTLVTAPAIVVGLYRWAF